MNSQPSPLLILSAALLLIASLACGSSNSGTQVGTSQQPTIAPPQMQVYRPGDIVQVRDHTIVLNTATITGGVLKANFTIENKGKADLAVSSMLSFSAKDGDSAKLEQQIFDCGPSTLDGKVLPGDKLRGDICWKTTADSARIYYEASLFGSGAVVWEVKK
jgi:hypothetical protein